MPAMMKALPGLMWAQYRKDYDRAMEIGREMMCSPDLLRRGMANCHPSEHDVFVCTYAKSGTYWMMQAVSQVAGKGSAEFDNIHDIVPWPETTMPGPVSVTEPTWESAPTKKRAVKTHAEAQFVPYNEAAKYVVVLRDPKDVVVSSFYFANSYMPGIDSIGIEAWADAFMYDRVPYGSWPEHTAGFWAWRSRPNVLIVSFEEMKADLRPVIDKLVALMGVSLTDAEMEKVLERCSFSYMKTNEERFKPPTVATMNSDITLLRSGKTGDSAEMLSAEKRAEIDSVMARRLQELGSDFPYAETYTE